MYLYLFDDSLNLKLSSAAARATNGDLARGHLLYLPGTIHDLIFSKPFDANASAMQ